MKKLVYFFDKKIQMCILHSPLGWSYLNSQTVWCCLDVRPSVTNLLGLYLKDFFRFKHETSGVYSCHSEKVHCTRTITRYCLILELLLFDISNTFV